MSTSRALRRVSAATVAAVLGFGGALLAVQPAAAADFVVSNTNDSGPGSLRDAVAQANGTPTEDDIVFATTGTITLLSTIAVTAPVDIEGPGVDALTITRDGSFDLLSYDSLTGPDFGVAGINFQGDDAEGDLGRAISAGNVGGGGAVIRDSSFSGFDTEGDGGAILIDSDGGAGLVNVVLSDNSATGDGGAVFARTGWNFVLDGVVGTGNSSAESGGAVYIDAPGEVRIVDSAFDLNEAASYGGAIQVDQVLAPAVLADSVFEGNSAGAEGGAIEFEDVSAGIRVLRVLFEGNDAPYGGALYLYDGLLSSGETFQVVDSTFTDNSAVEGGAFGFRVSSEDGSSEPVVLVDRSTFYANRLLQNDSGSIGVGVSIAAALDDGTVARVIDSTFDEVSDVTPAPGAIAVGYSAQTSLLEVFHSTVSGPASVVLLVNGAGEGDAAEVGAVNASHDILESTSGDDALVLGFASGPVSGDTARGTLTTRADATPAAAPALTDEGYTLEWSVVGTAVDEEFVVQGEGNQLETDPQLGELADNGGLTLTRLPAEASPAVNTGDPAVAGAPEIDQRHLPRIVETIDIGAVELPAPPPSLAATGGTVNYALLIGGAIVLLLGVAAIVFAALRRRKTPSGGE